MARALPGDFTRGRQELLAVLSLTDTILVAARARVTRGAVYQWTSGRWKPSADARRRLALNYGIRSEWWEERAPSSYR